MAATSTRPRRPSPHDEPEVVTRASTRPAWATDEAVAAEMDAQARARRPRARAAAGARRAASAKPPTLGRLGAGVRSAGSVAPARLRTDASGFILALLFWSWVALPVLRGGPAEVKDVLRAKFFNKKPDGSWLP